MAVFSRVLVIPAFGLALAGCQTTAQNNSRMFFDPGSRQVVAIEESASERRRAEREARAAELRRQEVAYAGTEAPGTIVIDTPNKFLYLVQGDGTALRYGIGVGREGFAWSGTQRITRIAEWPTWTPPAEMIGRQPYLPRWMAGGEGNPMGARGLYLGNTLYRIHGSNEPHTIGTAVSSGCIRMLNDDVIDLASRVRVGTVVVVRPPAPGQAAQAARTERTPGTAGRL